MSLRPQRPAGVTLVSVLYGFGFLAGVIGGGIITVYSRNGGQFLLGIFVTLLGIFSYIVGLALFRGRTWAWAPGVVGYGVTLVVTFIELTRGNFAAILGLVVSLWIILYMNSASVRIFFDKPRLSFLAVAYGFVCLLAFLYSLQVA